MTSAIIRQWKLLRKLESSPQGLPLSQLIGPTEATKRAFYRDVRQLQDAGFPLFTHDDGAQRHWAVTQGGRKMGEMPLPFAEIIALRWSRASIEQLRSTPFYDALNELIKKLDSYLTPSMRYFAEQLDNVVVGDCFGRLVDTPLRQLAETLGRARLDRYSVELSYRAQDGAESRRTVDPYNLWLHRGVPYLVAWCHERQAIRTFNLSRIVSVSATTTSFELSAGYTFPEFVRERFGLWGDGSPVPVRIRFAPEAALYVRERLWHPTQAIEEQPDGSVILALESDGFVQLTSWVLSFGPRARVLAPRELVDAVTTELSAACRQYDCAK